MTTETETLATWRDVTEGATEAMYGLPWVVDPDDPALVLASKNGGFDGSLVVNTWATSGQGRGDAESIAAFIATARDAMPRLLAFAEAVLALHRPVEVEPSDTICAECSTRLPNGRYMPTVEWPCPTAAALAEHLGGDKYVEGCTCDVDWDEVYKHD